MEELTCQQLVELVTAYLEDALAPDDRARFEAHLAECDGCRDYVDQFRVTIAGLGTLTTDTLSSTARVALLAAFRNYPRD